MTTRAEQMAECRDGGSVLVAIGNVVCGTAVKDASVTLTRDGELRERLKKLVEEWGAGSERSRECAAALSALLKEDGT